VVDDFFFVRIVVFRAAKHEFGNKRNRQQFLDLQLCPLGARDFRAFHAFDYKDSSASSITSPETTGEVDELAEAMGNADALARRCPATESVAHQFFSLRLVLHSIPDAPPECANAPNHDTLTSAPHQGRGLDGINIAKSHGGRGGVRANCADMLIPTMSSKESAGAARVKAGQITTEKRGRLDARWARGHTHLLVGMRT